MWVSRLHDLDRVRPLGSAGSLPGIGSRGAHSEASLRAIVAEAHNRLTSGALWRPTGGHSYRTYPFRRGGGQDTFRPLGQPEALPERTPFTACHGLATNRQLCTDVHARFAVRQ